MDLFEMDRFPGEVILYPAGCPYQDMRSALQGSDLGAHRCPAAEGEDLEVFFVSCQTA